MGALPRPPHNGGRLLETKFHPPATRRGHVARPRLVQQLLLGPARLTVISAPPGFGKTTLLGEWLGSIPAGSAAWLSLDRSDDSPSIFWAYVIEALSRVWPQVAESNARDLIDSSPPPPIETVLRLVINTPAPGAKPVWLILDDLHVIEDSAIQQAIGFLVEHAPSHLRVVLASRVDPAFPLARLRSRGELTEIRAADLRLTLAEATELLNGQAGLGIERHDLAALELRTEGWAAALQLIALTLRGHSDPGSFISEFTGNDRYVVDYLVEEVLHRQDTAMREFLLRTSVLDQFTAALCDAVLQSTGSRQMIDAAERGNLFIVPLDGSRNWFRYHHLFADVLRAQLAETYPAEAASLHHRASAWFSSNGHPEQAVRHALSAGDFGLAAAIIEREAGAIVRRHHPDRLIDWLKPIPDSVLEVMPVLSTYYGHALQGMGDLEGSHLRIETARRALLRPPEEVRVYDQHSAALLPALIAVGRGFLSIAAGDAEATLAHASKALPLLPSEEHHWRGTAVALLGLCHWVRGEIGLAEPLQGEAVTCFERAGDTGLAITAAYHHAELLRAAGDLNGAFRRLVSSLAAAERQTGGAARGVANLHIGLSELHCERNDLAAAARELEAAEELGIYPPRTPFRQALARARLLQCQGDLEGAVLLLDEAERLQIRGAVPDYRPVAAWRARLLAERGLTTDAGAWARSKGFSSEDPMSYTHEFAHLTLARIIEPRAARGLLGRLLAAAEAGGRMFAAIEARVLLASLMHTAGDAEEAVTVISPALTAGELQGYVRVFCDAGPAVGGLLELAASRGVAPGYCRKLLAAMHSPPASRPAGLPEPLSKRELAVLRLLATELTGPEIANHLVVSLNTLRTHTKRIYAKLDVTSRRAAVRRGRDFGLL